MRPIKYCEKHQCDKKYLADYGGRYSCDQCNNERAKRDRWKNIEKYRNIHRKSSRQPKRRFDGGVYSAKRRGLTFTVTLEQYAALINQPCYYCQDRFGMIQDNQTGVGLDRIDNSIGYEIGNVVSCCKICNQIKMDCLTVEETIAAINAIFEVRNAKKN